MRIGVFKGHSTDARVQSTVESFIKGLVYLGADYFVDIEYRDCDVAVIWGVMSKHATRKTRYRDEVRNAQQNTIVMERGFVRRDIYYSVGWGDTGGRGDYLNANAPSDRWEKLGVELAPWRTNGEAVLICGQIPHDTSVQHVDYIEWLRTTIMEVRRRTGREVIFRKHPLLAYDIGPFEGVTLSTDTLENDFKKAHAVITFNSTAGVEAVVEGIPAFSFDRRSMAYDVTSHDLADLENPLRPDRTAWANALAYSQWSIDEIERGEPWLHLKRRFDAA